MEINPSHREWETQSGILPHKIHRIHVPNTCQYKVCIGDSEMAIWVIIWPLKSQVSECQIIKYYKIGNTTQWNSTKQCTRLQRTTLIAILALRSLKINLVVCADAIKVCQKVSRTSSPEHILSIWLRKQMVQLQNLVQSFIYSNQKRGYFIIALVEWKYLDTIQDQLCREYQLGIHRIKFISPLHFINSWIAIW